MNRYVFIIFILSLIIFSSCNGKNIKNVNILGDEEQIISEYDFNNNLLNIYSNGISERLLLSKKISWGCWQISEDKTKILFWEYINGAKQYYFIDFKIGTYRKFNMLHDDFVLSRNFKYYVVPEKKDSRLIFELYEFENNNKIRNIEWKLENYDYAIDTEYYLSVSDIRFKNYDFEGYVGTDGSCCAIGLFGLDSSFVETIYEYSEGDDEQIITEIENLISRDFVDRRIK